MKRKHSVLMAQANYHYGKNVFIPYSVGSLQAYAQIFPEIKESFRFQRPLFLRTNPDKIIKNRKEPAIACFSSYLWNWEYNNALAKKIRAAHPNCLIVFGGTQVPNASQDFFTEHPYVDILVHQEGELAFADILREFLMIHPDYTRIPGLSVRIDGNKTLRTGEPVRIRDLSVLPSPYLSGVFDFLLKRKYTLNASQETNRGCPYSCSFCDWGGNTFSKVFVIDEARLLEEFEWFGKNKIEYIFNCDANYGIMPRDYALTEKMVAIRAKHGGFPNKFRMCTAKNSNDKIFAIAKLLNDAGMNKGATLSFQSMDPHTLDIVRRSNIKLDVFSSLMSRYKAAGIATYTELIMGMPGETYESTKNGIDALLDRQADSVNISVYVCSMLPNSEMSDPEYVEKHKIKSVKMPILLAHSTPDEESSGEYQDMVIETSSMSNDDWKRGYLFYWAVQGLHCLGPLQKIAMLFRNRFGVKYSDFYEKFIGYFSEHKQTLIGRQFVLIKELVDRAMDGGRLDLVLPKFGEIYWPLEEASYLAFVADKNNFYTEVRFFVSSLASATPEKIDAELLDDVVLYQSAVIRHPNASETLIDLNYDLHGYFKKLPDPSAVPEKRPVKLLIKVEQEFAGNLENFAREVVWYGRKGGKFFHSNVTIKP